ncbi:MAG: hypothetical protein ABJC89_06325, partial [Acidobacteriota bacterium]
ARADCTGRSPAAPRLASQQRAPAGMAAAEPVGPVPVPWRRFAPVWGSTPLERRAAAGRWCRQAAPQLPEIRLTPLEPHQSRPGPWLVAIQEEPR